MKSCGLETLENIWGATPTSNYSSGLDDTSKQAVISQQRLRSNMLVLYIKNSLATDSKRKLRAFNYVYTFNAQDGGAAMLFIIVKMMRPDSRSGCSDINYKLENMKISHFNNDIPKANLHIAE